MHQLVGTAATLVRAEAAAERARAKLGSEADFVIKFNRAKYLV